MRAVITEMRALALHFAIEVILDKRELPILRQASRETRLWTLHLDIAIMLRRGFHAPRLGPCSDVKTRVSTLASWCCAGGDD